MAEFVASKGVYYDDYVFLGILKCIDLGLKPEDALTVVEKVVKEKTGGNYNNEFYEAHLGYLTDFIKYIDNGKLTPSGERELDRKHSHFGIIRTDFFEEFAKELGFLKSE